MALSFWNKIKEVWNSIANFFGFGDEEAEVNIKVSKTEEGNIIPTSETPDASGLLLKSNTASAGTGEANGINGSSGSGKTITMHLDIKNYFNMAAGNWKDKADEVADVVVGKIVDRMRDSTIALE